MSASVRRRWRALRLLDAAVKAWERLGGQIRVGSSHDEYAYSRDRKTWAVMDEDQVAFSLSERMRQLPSQKDTSLGIHTGPEYVHTGRLVLRIEGAYGAPRHTWSDGKRQRLEDVLDSFVEGLLRQIGQRRIDRAEKACRERQREKVAERREQEKRRREEEQERRKELETELARWVLAGRIRTYLTALREGIEAGRFQAGDLQHFEGGSRGAGGTLTASIRSRTPALRLLSPSPSRRPTPRSPNSTSPAAPAEPSRRWAS